MITREVLDHGLRLATEDQLFRALLAQEENGRLLWSILVGDGVLYADDLKRALKAKAEETQRKAVQHIPADWDDETREELKQRLADYEKAAKK